MKSINIKTIVATIMLVASTAALSYGGSSTTNNVVGANHNTNKAQSSARAGAFAGSLAGSKSTSNGGKSTATIGDILTKGGHSGDSSAHIGDTRSKAEGGDGFGGDAKAKGGAVTNNVIDSHDYPDIPANAVWTLPAICTSSQAASALKLSVSSSETDAMCMRLSIAQTQWDMANRCGSNCDEAKNTAMSTINEMSKSLAEQSSGDRVYTQTKRWSSLAGFLVTIVSIL